MEHKSFSLGEFKALSDTDEPGTFEAVAAVFGNVDHGGDRIAPGAFKRSLGEWAAKGRNVPVLWSHDAEQVPIGVVTDASETHEGLKVKARLLVDDHPQARAVYAAMKAGALHEFSFGYGTRDSSKVIENGKQIRVLKDLDLAEISPVFRGMNPATRLTGVKSDVIDLDRLAIDELKSLADRVHETLERRQELALKEAARPAENPPPDPAPISETDPPPPTPTPVPHQKPEDNPEPNPADEAGEEAKARIRRLLAEHPIHIQETPQ